MWTAALSFQELLERIYAVNSTFSLSGDLFLEWAQHIQDVIYLGMIIVMTILGRLEALP